jgi:hydrogenase-4 component B
MIAVFLGVLLLMLGPVMVWGSRDADSRVRADDEHHHSAGDVAFSLLVLAGCVIAGSAAVWAIGSGATSTIVMRSGVPGGSWVFTLDTLSAVFVLVVCFVGAACAVFGVRYLAHERAQRPVAFTHAVFATVLAAMVLVVTAHAVVPFLIAWEVMAVGSYFLIVHEHEHTAVRRAGLIYLAATHTGTLALIAMFALWSGQASDWSFAALAHAAPGLPHHAGLVLTLAILGFGFKAGIVPLHFWLPPAHASGPSHVSAMLSGIVIKMGIYGLLRVVMLLDGAAPAWWGWAVLTLGTVSGVLGVLWALAQHDIKRLLAYHSVENIGIILMGIGVGVLGVSSGHPLVAALGFAGAVLHTVNHALFKSVLFLGAGAVQRAVGTRDMEQLGGLAKRMPWTWLAFIIGATAIAGLPPLNGFVSEWLVYLGLFRSAQATDTLRLAALGVPALALIGALALACFAKVSGIVFLGTARSARAADALEVPPALRIPTLVLAGACVVLGAVPVLGVVPALRVATAVAHLAPADAQRAGLVVRDAWWISAMSAAVFLLFAGLWIARRRALGRRVVRQSITWACGAASTSPRMQYTASSFAAPLLSTFGRLSGVVEHRAGNAFHTHPVDLVLDRAAGPVWRRIQRAALRLRPIQQGRLFAYLLYVMVALMVLLGYLALVTRR